MSPRKFLSFVVILLFSLLLPLPHNAVKASDPGQANPPGPADPAEVETFIDGFITAQLNAYHVPGATVSIVKDGRLFFAKGYGYADLEQRIPVRADQTLFRTGSISKLFIWTAVMQLVEQGKLDLNADINTYLDIKVPASGDFQPITLQHLLTHTPGFEDFGLGLFTHDPNKIQPLGAGLAKSVPGRVFPPGKISAYSNYGAGLAGYIVERVSEMPFDAYVETHILNPLGMAHTTFRQPLPAALAQDMSTGYVYAGGRYQAGSFEYVQPYPAGAMSATAADMAAFMIAHLQNGRYGDAQILKEETARQMHALQFSHDPRVAGWGEGFSVTEQNGLKAVGHGGDTVYFHSEMILLPEENVGVFISTNSDKGVFMRFDFINRFFERYYPIPVETPRPPDDFQQRASNYTGTYYPARMSFSTVEKTLALVQPVTVLTTPDRLLQVNGLLGPEPTYWVEVEPKVFISVNQNLPANTHLVFKTDEGPGGKPVDYIFFGEGAYIKQPWYGASGFQVGLLGLSLFVFLTAVIVYPARGLVRRYYRKAYPGSAQPSSRGARLALWAGWAFALLSVLFWLVFTMMMSNLNQVIFGLPPVMEAIMYVPWILAVLLIAVLLGAVFAWLRKYWTLTGRIFYTVLALTAIAYIWFLSYWNLL